MPPVSRVMVRTALIHLALGSTIGGLLLAEKGLGLFPWLWLLRPSHTHLLLVGWTVQLAFGVAVWIMPRLDAAGNRGNIGLVWLCYGALNGGVALAALHPPLAALLGGLPQWPLAAAGLLYLIAAVAAVAHIWRRVRPFGAAARDVQA